VQQPPAGQDMLGAAAKAVPGELRASLGEAAIVRPREEETTHPRRV